MFIHSDKSMDNGSKLPRVLISKLINIKILSQSYQMHQDQLMIQVVELLLYCQPFHNGFYGNSSPNLPGF